MSFTGPPPPPKYVKRGDSLREKMYRSSIFMTLDHKNKFEVLKNRYGKHGTNFSVDGVIEIFSEVISTMIFKNEMMMFQEGVKTNLNKALNKTVKEVISMEGGDDYYDTL